MSAVLTDGRAQAPQQLGLEGLAPPAEPLTNLVIAGRLARRAMLRLSADGRPHFTVEIRQAGRGLPFVACYHGTADETAELEAMAHRFTPGTAVIVRGAGLALDTFHDQEVLFLTECRLQPREIRFDDPQEAALV